MLNKIKNHIKINYINYLILLFFIFIIFFPLNYYILSPGSLIDLDKRIIVDTEYKSKGSFNLTYVTTRKATIFTYFLSYLIPSWERESINESRIDKESNEDILNRGQLHLKETSFDAIVAAFSLANKEYKIKSENLVVSYIFSWADTNIEVGDIIKNIDYKKINSLTEISEALLSKNENDLVSIKVEKDRKTYEKYAKVKIIDGRKVIGISIVKLKEIETSPSVKYIFNEDESGSSRGLMCALYIYDKITKKDLTNGNVISGTGSIDEKGNVGSIDGVKYKLKGAVKKKANVFIVPSENYEEAIKLKNEEKYDIDIIEAKTLYDIVEKLKNR